MTHACPDEPTLRSFAVGALDSEQLDDIAAHLLECALCESALAALDSQADRLVLQLRRAGADGSTENVRVPARLLYAAREALCPQTEAGSSELVSDLGRRITNSLEHGSVRLGKYELLAVLGTGSFGTVFRARDTELDRVVAVKIQHGTAFDRQDSDRFLREARSAAQLKHHNIVSLYDTHQTEDGVCYLVTEFVEGETLEQRLRRAPLDVREAATLVAEVADALHYAHTHGVIHRDVKPSNILLNSEQQPVVMDFGLAKRETGEVTVTRDGEVMGTPAYMSPEQARGESHHVDPRSDIYSLAVVLYECLTAERPFQGNRRMLLLQVLEDEPRSPRRLNDKIPRDLETVCLKGLAKDPARRYATARDFAEDLRRFLRGAPIQARPIGRMVRLWHWCRRNPLAASLFVAVSLCSVVGLLSLTNLSEAFVRKTALNSARMQSDMLEQVNSLYSEIVERVQPHNITITHDYAGDEEAIPLPATFTIEAGRRISCSKSGMQVRLYSEFPFPWREDGGPRDEFEREALQRLKLEPAGVHYQFVEQDGHPVLRYATARRMNTSCLGCHNHHPDSPKTDWKVGDVRGVLEIIRPLDKEVARTRKTLRGTFIVLGIISVLLFGLPVLTIVTGYLRRRS